jgi:hypothetical protein
MGFSSTVVRASSANDRILNTVIYDAANDLVKLSPSQVQCYPEREKSSGRGRRGQPPNHTIAMGFARSDIVLTCLYQERRPT